MVRQDEVVRRLRQPFQDECKMCWYAHKSSLKFIIRVCVHALFCRGANLLTQNGKSQEGTALPAGSILAFNKAVSELCLRFAHYLPLTKSVALRRAVRVGRKGLRRDHPLPGGNIGDSDT